MNIPKKVLLTIVSFVLLGVLVPVLWPLMQGTTEDIAAINGTDAGTGFLQAAWPIGLLLIGIAIAVGLLVWAIRRFSILGRGR